MRRKTIQTKEEVEALVDEIMALNPGANRANLLKGAKFNEDGLLTIW